MKIFWTILVIYLVIMNIAAMSMTIIDKQRAMRKHNYNRISERALLLTALLGGASLMYLTMLTIRHKTKHKKFMITLPIFCILWVVILILLWLKPPLPYNFL